MINSVLFSDFIPQSLCELRSIILDAFIHREYSIPPFFRITFGNHPFDIATITGFCIFERITQLQQLEIVDIDIEITTECYEIVYHLQRGSFRIDKWFSIL